MFTRQEYKNNLLGWFEIMLFMKRGVARFSGSRDAALRSFLWPLLLMPVVLFAFSFHSTGFSLPLLLTLHGARVVITMGLFLTVVYFLGRQYGRERHFFQFVTIANWGNIPVFILFLPIMTALVLQSAGLGLFASYDEVVATFATYAVFSQMLWYVYTAFVLTHALRMPWETGAFAAVCGMAIDQQGLHVTMALRDYLAGV